MPSRMYQRVAANKNNLFKVEDGKLELLGIKGRLYPLLTLAIMEEFLKENFDEKRIADALYLIGEAQSYHATKWMVKKVGIPLEGNELKIFRETAGHSEIMGLGIVDIVRFDIKNKTATVKVSNNDFYPISQSLFGNRPLTDNFLRGIVGGVLHFLFQKPVVVACEPRKIQGGGVETIYNVVTQERAERDDGYDHLLITPGFSLSSLEKFNLQNLS